MNPDAYFGRSNGRESVVGEFMSYRSQSSVGVARY
jgi:hypothetical protein